MENDRIKENRNNRNDIEKGGDDIDQTFEVTRSCKYVLARLPVGFINNWIKQL
jgi:hypothetical protein